MEREVRIAKEPFQLNIFGPQAVGKMTVGFEVQRLTGAALVHAHMVGDLLTEVFEFGTEPFVRLAYAIREGIIREAAATGTNLIGTAVPTFTDATAMQKIVEWAALVDDAGGEALFVELDAPLSVRIRRSDTEFRRSQKKTDWATEEELTSLAEWHMHSDEAGVTLPGRRFRIDSSELSAADVAERIVEEFDLSRHGAASR